MARKTRREVIAALGATTAVGVAGCSSGNGAAIDVTTGSNGTTTDPATATTEGTSTSGGANVRVAHFSPDAPAVDVYVDGSRALADVAFGTVSDYLSVPEGTRTVEITAAGDPDTVAFEGDLDLVAADYTVAAVGELSSEDTEFRPLVLEDDNAVPAGTTARLRLVHASPDAPAVDVTLACGGQTLYDDVSFGESGYVEVPAGTYTLQVRGATEDDDGEVVSEFRVELAGGTVYTAFAGGYLTPGDEPADRPFDLTAAVDAGAGGGGVLGPSMVRVAHLSPDAPNVDVYLDGSRALADVPYGAVSDSLELASGRYTLAITAAGDPDAVAFEDEVTLEPGPQTVAALGELSSGGEEFRPLVLPDDDRVPGEDAARVRLVHASPDAPDVDVTLASNGEVLYDGLAFGESAYVEVPAGTYTLQVRGDTEDDDGEVVSEFRVELAGGTVYTAFAGGYLTPGDEPADRPFDLTLSVDAGAGGGGIVEPARVRVAHLSPDAPNVDVYVDDSRALADVPFGTVSDYLELVPDAYTVAITAAGDPSAVAFKGDLTLESGPYTVAAVGELSSEDTEFRPLLLDDDAGDVDGDSAGVRLVHASPDAPAVDVTVASTGEVLADGLAFGESEYAAVPAGDDTLQLRVDSEDDDDDVFAQFDVDLAGGTRYTAFALGYLTTEHEPGDAGFEVGLAVNATS